MKRFIFIMVIILMVAAPLAASAGVWHRGDIQEGDSNIFMTFEDMFDWFFGTIGNIFK